MVDDSRYRQRVFLEDKIIAANIVKDDLVTLASYIHQFAKPNYSNEKTFITKGYDAVFSVEMADQDSLAGFNQKTYGYDDNCVIIVNSIDKTGVSGAKMQNTCLQELRRIYEANPLGSVRRVGRLSNTPIDQGGYKLYESKYQIHYRRAANQAHTTASITYGHGKLYDFTGTTAEIDALWTEDQDTNTGTFVGLHGDWVHLNVTAQGGAGNYSIANNDDLELDETVYTKVYWRYICGNATIKAKIVLIFDDATEVTVLAETNSTTWTVGSAPVASAAGNRELDHIELFANDVNGDVYYDFVLVCKGAFIFPNIVSLDPMYEKREVILGIPSKGGDSTQGLGTKNAEYEIVCDMSIDDWTRMGDNKNGDVFRDIWHESHDEPWQWLDTEIEQFKATLSSVNMPQGEGLERSIIRLHENNVATRNNEFWYQRLGTDL